MKERPILFSEPMVRAIFAGNKTQSRRIVKPQRTLHDSPYGKPGDHLWVREKFRESGNCQRHDGKMPSKEAVDDCSGRIIYAQDDPGNGPWRSPIFMPRWASRITLEVAGIDVERLQDISEQDAWAEGITDLAAEFEQWDGDPDQGRKVFRQLWESIHGPDSWNQNPWVWKISFRRIEP